MINKFILCLCVAGCGLAATEEQTIKDNSSIYGDWKLVDIALTNILNDNIVKDDFMKSELQFCEIIRTYSPNNKFREITISFEYRDSIEGTFYITNNTLIEVYSQGYTNIFHYFITNNVLKLHTGADSEWTIELYIYNRFHEAEVYINKFPHKPNTIMEAFEYIKSEHSENLTDIKNSSKSNLFIYPYPFDFISMRSQNLNHKLNRMGVNFEDEDSFIKYIFWRHLNDHEIDLIKEIKLFNESNFEHCL